MATRSSRTAAAAVALALCACLAGKNAFEPPPAGGHHVLFVGNSLTNANDLPGMLTAIAESAGDTIRTATVWVPGAALIDHYTSGDARGAIAAGGWEYVVMQQGPTSTTGVDRDTLVLATKLFDPLIRAVGATPALFMVWPDITRIAYWDNCRTSYLLAAQAVGGVFMPAGEAWREASAVDTTLALYGSDGLHPSVLGTYLAALEIYERVTGHDARDLPVPAAVGGMPVADATVRLLQAAAHTANTKYPATP